MARKALITWGGWEGHEPEKVAQLFRGMLEAEGFEVAVHDTLACLEDAEALRGLDLIVPVWTMSEIAKESVQNVSEAVARGTGLAGVHGGMCDAFRGNTLWQFMTGGNWVAHPGGDGVRYRVNIANSTSPLVAGIADFEVESEQYYLHVDPAVEVLATTRFPVVTWYHSPNGPVDMPVAWTKRWGLGRVYYNALGHQANVIDHGPAQEMIRRGLLWAADGKQAAAGADVARFQAPGNHT
ncbi:Trehalose utilization [Pseudoruegeria aquimaris]|uniref:Trehalose utilization n=1 Tax=Pseudoruegeria aquimaris TaxID=393663 RepID=A0A1Y5S3C4_9RHOB|nr:ThuA domain-containing protein [Pseudoruegeria aquimaris]SLN30695.1 Trehalose utilization [Pseudoruegeria aquimaris]